MHLFFDESGDYALPEWRYDCYAQAALVCPDSELDALDEFVRSTCGRWGVEEIHATDLTPHQRLEICEFIQDAPVQLLAHVTDTELTTTKGLQEWRLGQAHLFKRSLGRYHAMGGTGKGIEDFTKQHINKAGLPTRIAHGEFVQATLLINVIAEALQKSLYFFHDDRWRNDFWDFHFIIDGKLPEKLAAGEKYLSDCIKPFLGSDERFSLGLVDTWKVPPVHPFIKKFEKPRGRRRGRWVEKKVLDLNAIFEHGLRFEPSHDHAGLQLADVVANTVRKAVMEPFERDAQRAFELMRRKLRNEDGHAIRIAKLGDARTDESADAETAGRYRHVWHT